MGGALIAMAFGWHPFGGQVGPATQAPTKDKAPSTNVPTDQLPTKK
jgi:hypothetical protein